MCFFCFKKGNGEENAENRGVHPLLIERRRSPATLHARTFLICTETREREPERQRAEYGVYNAINKQAMREREREAAGERMMKTGSSALAKRLFKRFGARERESFNILGAKLPGRARS